MAFMDYMPQFGQNIPNQVVGAQDDATAQLLLKRRLAQADLLKNTEMPQGQVVSGHYVAPSWTQYLASAYNKIAGNQAENEAMRDYMGFQKTEREKQAEALRNLGRDISPVAETQQGSYDIQVPNGQTPTPADKVGAMQPYESGYKTISVPMTTETGKMRPRTQEEIYKAIADYSSSVRNPALLEKTVLGRVEAALTPKKPIELGAGAKLIDPTNYNVLATNPKEGSESKSTLEKEYDFMVAHGYKGSAQDYFDMKRSMTDKERNDLDIRLKQLGIDQWNLYYNTGYGTPPGGGLKKGATVNGFVYNGGDPNQQSSWSKK